MMLSPANRDGAQTPVHRHVGEDPGKNSPRSTRRSCSPRVITMARCTPRSGSVWKCSWMAKLQTRRPRRLNYVAVEGAAGEKVRLVDQIYREKASKSNPRSWSTQPDPGLILPMPGWAWRHEIYRRDQGIPLDHRQPRTAGSDRGK